MRLVNGMDTGEKRDVADVAGFEKSEAPASRTENASGPFVVQSAIIPPDASLPVRPTGTERQRHPRPPLFRAGAHRWAGLREYSRRASGAVARHADGDGAREPLFRTRVSSPMRRPTIREIASPS